MTWARDDVLREAQQWVWAPPGTNHLQLDWCYALQPEGTDHLTLAWITPAAAVTTSWDRIRALVSETGCAYATITVSDTPDQAPLERLLLDKGAELRLTHEILGIDLSGDQVVGVVHPEVTSEVVSTLEQWRAAMSVAGVVWGGAEPTAEDETAQQAALAKPIQERGGFQVLARYQGVPAATGGVTLAGPVARLWGACTLPEHRGEGAYRATVINRLTESARHGATLALAKGIANTSAPILTKIGFTSYGTTRDYLVDFTS